MKSLALLTLGILPVAAQPLDLYPQVHSLLLEVEAASANMRLLNDRSNPHSWAAQLYAHAGYLEDAERAFTKSSGSLQIPPFPLWRAWVVYGRPERAEKSLQSIADPEEKVAFLTSFGDLLWRMGQPEQARLRFEAARQLAPKVVSLERRKQLLASVDQSLQFIAEPPPNPISATPHPPPKLNLQDSPIPLFPITPDGFDNAGAKETADRSSANADFMKELYDRVAARDREGLQHLAEHASTPFQKALGFASIEHLLILTGQPELAEQFAKIIPETDSSSMLAKAEALTAAANAWLPVFNDDRARADFDAAIHLVQAVPDLLFGKLSVLASIATAQFKGHLIRDGSETFRAAATLAQYLPLRPKPQPGIARRTAPGVHYKDEAFKKLLFAAIKAGDTDVAHDLDGMLSRTGDNSDSSVVDAWLEADRPEEAITAARQIEDPQSRVEALLNLAQVLLNRAGAPNF